MSPFSTVWLLLMVMFLITEAVTVTMVSLWFAGGSLAALIVALTGGSFSFQVFTMLVVSTALAWWLDVRMFRTANSVKDRAVPVLALPQWGAVAVYAFMYLAVILIGQFGASGFIYFNF